MGQANESLGLMREFYSVSNMNTRIRSRTKLELEDKPHHYIHQDDLVRIIKLHRDDRLTIVHTLNHGIASYDVYDWPFTMLV